MGIFYNSNSWESKYSLLLIEVDNLKEKINNLEIENNNLKKQSRYENEIDDGIALTHGEYISGVDIQPGRYSFKVIYGTQGVLETTGRDWVIIYLGEEYEHIGGVKEYRNLTLKKDVKLKIKGNIKILMQKQDPINIDEDISIIQQQNQEVEMLKKQLKEARKTIQELKLSFNEPSFDYVYIWKCGCYYGGETIAPGIYDLEVASGEGYVKERGNYHRMGNVKYGTLELIGLKVSNKTKIEVTGSVQIKAVRKNIKTY